MKPKPIGHRLVALSEGLEYREPFYGRRIVWLEMVGRFARQVQVEFLGSLVWINESLV